MAYFLYQNKIEWLKEDNLAIGSYTETHQKHYTNHIVPLQKGDTIYVFSDGYSDQFGGPDGKKFKLTQFKTMLLNLNGVSMEQQKVALERSIEEWRGVLQQVDDMLVIGVKIWWAKTIILFRFWILNSNFLLYLPKIVS